MKCDYQTNKQLVDLVVSGMECDDEWDVSMPIEKGYAMAGLKRIKITHRSGLTSIKDLDSTCEEISSAKGQDHKEQLALGASGSSSVTIKIENPASLEAKQAVDVIKSAEGKMNSLIKDFKWLAVLLEVQKGNPMTTEASCAFPSYHCFASLHVEAQTVFQLLQCQIVLQTFCGIATHFSGMFLRHGYGGQGQQVFGSA